MLTALPAALMVAPAFASDRSLHLHAASHAPLREPARAHAPAEPRNKTSRRSAAAGDHGEARGHAGKPGKGAAAKSKATASSTGDHAKGSRRKRREPEIVDDPITLHRAKGKSLSRSSAKERLLAHERETPLPHLRPNSRRDRLEIAEEAADRAAAARAVKQQQAYAALHPHTNTAPQSIVLSGARPLEAFPRSAAAPQRAALQSRQAFAEGEASPEDGGAVSAVQSASGAPPPREKAPRSVVIRPAADQEAIVSAAPVRDRPSATPRVVTGFGAEVAETPAGRAADRNVPSVGAGTTQQQQMDIADDAGEVADASAASPRTLADNAMQPMVLPMYTRSGKLVMPAPLRGSREILVHQNTMADHDGLERIRDDRELNRMLSQHMLVSFPESASLRVNYGLPENRRYARPWTVRFVADAAHAFYAEFGEPLQVNSAVRTVSYQRRLQRVNGNAAATSGDGASPHLTGQAIDLAKRGMTSDEIGWMRTFLAPFMEAGKIDVEEEFQQACFHISVYRAYGAAPRHSAPKLQVARAEPRSARPIAGSAAEDEANEQ